MDSYNFWADLFDTFQSSPDWIKVLWIVSVPALPLGVLALLLRFKLASMRLESRQSGRLAYSVVADEAGGLRIYVHEERDGLRRWSSEPPRLPIAVTSPARFVRPRPDA